MWWSKSSRSRFVSSISESLLSPKEEYFSFEQIRRYLDKSGKENIRQTISDNTSSDLDLDDVFVFIDRTISKVGQQYLYYSLHTIPKDTHRHKVSSQLINSISESPELYEMIITQFSKLGSNDAYGIASLFLDPQISKPKWFWVMRVLSSLSLVCFILGFAYNWFFIPLIALFATNLIFHIWNKGNLFNYSSSIPQLIALKNVALNLIKFPTLVDGEINETIYKSVAGVDSICKKMSVFNLEVRLKDDMTMIMDSVFEYVKILFLLEPILLFGAVKKIEDKREEIHSLFCFIGQIDMALSILNLRKSIKLHCIPNIYSNEDTFEIKNIYHPIINNCVKNSISTKQKSILLTGSNMSGKTSFIRSIGINAILAQTINTCFASQFTMPTMNVHTSIRISDDLLNDKSYYFQEVSTIKTLIQESTSGIKNLFLLDEIFKGTNTIERVAAGKSVLSYLSNQNLVFVSTHDSELAEYLDSEFDMYHFTETIKDGNILFDYKLNTGVLKTTNAIEILKINRYPDSITEEAESIASSLKNIPPQQ